MLNKLFSLLMNVLLTLIAFVLIVQFAPVAVTNMFLNPVAVVKGLQYEQEKEYKKEMENSEANFKKLIKENREAVFDKNSPFFGSTNPKTEVVVFFDYKCGYCRALANNIANVMKDAKYSNNVKFIVRDFPILSPLSRDLSILGVKSFKASPETFLAVHEKLFNVENKDTAIAQIKILTKGANIDLQSNDIVLEMIEKNLELGQALGIQGTPAIIIGDELISGLISEEQIKEKLDAQLSKK
jgi:protein-disulfide isomerase